MKLLLFSAMVGIAVANSSCGGSETKASKEFSTIIKITNGEIEGVKDSSGLFSFKGIPFAAPPVGDLRWKEPQPVANWTGVRKADKFGPRAMQKPIFGDMNFRSDGVSEDCLYLNVWTPAKSADEKLPVLVYFYGGGFIAGDGSEPRYDGESMARKGIVALTVNYRLGVFGFFSHPELSSESSHKASGNYGFLDQAAALKWVQQNIAAFGGDPKRVTIAGESAGSISVSALMASPLSKDLMAGAIGESGSIMGTLTPSTLAEGEKNGEAFATIVGGTSLQALRAISADSLLNATVRPDVKRFPVVVDGYFFPKQPVEIFSAGEQSRVPLLAGWNSQEMIYKALLGADEPTPSTYRKAIEKNYGDQATEILKLYPGNTTDEVIKNGTDLAGDRFIGFSTWKWTDIHRQTSGKPVYRYYYSRPRPEMVASMGNATANLAGGVTKGTTGEKPPPASGAVHSAEIEYAMGNLASNKVFDWKPDDYKVSRVMQDFFANFIKTGDPNGDGLPKWNSVSGDVADVMIIDVNTRSEKETTRDRYLFLDKSVSK